MGPITPSGTHYNLALGTQMTPSQTCVEISVPESVQTSKSEVFLEIIPVMSVHHYITQ